MTTMYDTLRGPTYEPLPVELWTYQGECLGRVGGFESMTFNVTGKTGQAATAVLEVYLDQTTALLVPCDGSVLVAARYNGHTLLYVPVSARVRALDDDPTTALLTVQCVGGWSFLEGSITTPGLDGELTATPNITFTIKGALEDMVKRLIVAGQKRVGHPIVVAPSMGRGPRVVVTGDWDSVGELVTKALTGSGYVLTFTGWVPGDPQPLDDTVLTAPCYVVDLKPYTPVRGLYWSYLSGDLSTWSFERKRASATRAVAGNGAEEIADRSVMNVAGVEPASPWARREVYVNHKPEKTDNADPIRYREEVEAAGVDKLAELGAALEVEAAVEHTAGWEYGKDRLTPRQYDVGDIATVELPVIGEVVQVVTEVELKLTPDTFTVTPTVGTPDTLALNTYDMLAGMDKRLARLEKRG